MRLPCLWMGVLLLDGCAKDNGSAVADMTARTVTLPDGSQITAELKIDRASQAVGMMYRDSLPEGRGLLFLYSAPVKESYWMHNVKVPLDIIWLDAAHNVVEIAPNAAPCPKPPRECPGYGGHHDAIAVLELNGGAAGRHGVRVGSHVSF